MPTANEIVRKNQKVEAEKATAEFETKPRSVLENWLTQLQDKALELKNCNACAKRRQKIKEKIERLTAFLSK